MASLTTADDKITHEYQGIIYPKPVAALTELQDWEVRRDDVVVVTYPKSGSTWMQEVASCILNDGDLGEVNKLNTMFRAVFLEMFPVNHHSQIGKVKKSPQEVLDSKPSPRLYRTHLPASALPRQIFTKQPKIIYVYHNPKDVLVSYYYFHGSNSILPEYSSFEAFFTDFCRGRVSSGPWHEHVLYWWSKRHEPNVLLISYEEMTKDLKSSVLRVAEFLEHPLPSDKINTIVRHCSFGSMKKNPNANVVIPTSTERKGPKENFYRKGVVGDWREHFTVAQNATFDVLCREWLKDSELMYDLKSYL